MRRMAIVYKYYSTFNTLSKMQRVIVIKLEVFRGKIPSLFFFGFHDVVQFDAVRLLKLSPAKHI